MPLAHLIYAIPLDMHSQLCYIDYVQMEKSIPKSGNQPVQIAPSAYTKAEKRLVFIRALRSTSCVAEAARQAGVTAKTGYAWQKILSREEALTAARSTIKEKADVATILSKMLEDESLAPRDRIKAADSLGAYMGYHAPSRSVVTQITVPPSVQEWLAGLDSRVDAPNGPQDNTVGAPTIAQPVDPKQLTDKATG